MSVSTTEANGSWTITVVDGTHIDLQGSAFSNTYTSGGYVAGSIEDLGVNLDDISGATLAQIAAFNCDDKLCFFSGDTLEATLETSERSSVVKRQFVAGGSLSDHRLAHRLRLLGPQGEPQRHDELQQRDPDQHTGLLPATRFDAACPRQATNPISVSLDLRDGCRAGCQYKGRR